MTDVERHFRAQNFKERFERQLPDFAQKCHAATEIVILHQNAFAMDYQEAEFSLLGKAIKYAGLFGKEVRVIGGNSETLMPHVVQ